MIALTPDTYIDEACGRLREFAQIHGRVPVCWMWGPDVRAVMDDAHNLTGAQMTERCVFRALERYWKEPRT